MLSDFFDTFYRLGRPSTPDGLGGTTGNRPVGTSFRAGLVRNTSTEMRIAEQNGAKAIYALLTTVDVQLSRDDHVQGPDGKRYRITDSGNRTPSVASTQYNQYGAEAVSV